MRNALLAAWIALMMATRIDVLGGSSELKLTPFLVLSPLILLIEASAAWIRKQPLRLPDGLGSYLTWLISLSIALAISTFLAYDLGASLRRFALFLAVVGFVFAVGLTILNRPDPSRILLQGAWWGLAAVFTFNALQAVALFVDPASFGVVGRILDVRPGSIAGIVPRFTGASVDPNHGGFFTVFLIWLLATLAPASKAKNLFLAGGVAAVLLTLSRSAVLAGLAAWIVFLSTRRTSRVRTAWFAAALLAAALLLPTYVAYPRIVESIAGVVPTLAERFSPQEGSSSEHMQLLMRGWEVGTDNIRHLLIGIGYGNAFVFTQDIFPGNEYGNFHSLFLTFFVEAGLLASAICAWMFWRAYQSVGPTRPMIIALLVFNIFQQSHTEPNLWFCLLLAWVPAGFLLRPGPSGEPGQRIPTRVDNAPGALDLV